MSSRASTNYQLHPLLVRQHCFAVSCLGWRWINIVYVRVSRAGEAFLFQHAVIMTIPGHFLTSQCYSWLASWMRVFMYCRNKGRAHTFVTLLDKFEQTEVETRASFVPIKVLEFSSCSVSSCLSAAASRAYPGTWTHQAVAQLLYLMLIPFCKASFSVLQYNSTWLKARASFFTGLVIANGFS